MIDIKLLRQDAEQVRSALARRLDPALDATLERLAEFDRRRREALVRTEALKARRNAATEEVARRKKARENADDLLAELKLSSDEVKQLDAEVRAIEAELDLVLMTVPNLPLPEVPDGDASGNLVVKQVGEIPKFGFTPKPHWELGAALGLFDLPRGAKIAGSGFPLFTGAGARLVRALKNFMLDLHGREHGYEEIVPPLLVNRTTMTGTGQLPKFEEELYLATQDDLFLLPTAEVPVTNIYRDDILDGARLPLGMCAFTPCFRREAGAAGKDTRGLIRVHQFDKVELVRFCRPEDSPAEHEKLTRHAETVLERLEIPYRRLALAAGDTGFASARTFDLEVWAVGVGTWLEASSSSTFTDFQARRANIRFRREPGGKPEFVHTLNASGVAFPRTIIAILENNQDADGSVKLPKALVPYFGAERLVPGA
ncbi:MAG TPA: serine--tRNA ligase [Gemmatimonadales bacterium]|nr:serine--tRNA ligase [Gemmatimonadales bacterium]